MLCSVVLVVQFARTTSNWVGDTPMGKVKLLRTHLSPVYMVSFSTK